MFSKELESVIEAALADGVLTDKERAVLHKRAAEEGVDPDELDVVIEGRLAKMKREEDWLRPTPPSDKFGEVKKCPRCGEPVEPMAVKCSACGYEFRGVEALKSSQQLADKLDEIAKYYRDKKVNPFLQPNHQMNSMNEQARVIKSFPVPTTKEDLLDFAISMQSKWKNTSGVYEPQLKKAYKAKYDECINKAKILFTNDSMFQSFFEQHQIDGNEQRNPRQKAGCMSFMALAIIVTTCLYIIG